MKNYTTIRIINPSLINPFFFYDLFWGLSLVFYIASPSKLNRTIDIGLSLFIFVTLGITAIFAINYNRKYKNRTIFLKNIQFPLFLHIVLFNFIILEFIYSDNIPLISAILGKNSLYQEFGIPTLHVIVVTLALLTCIYSFFRYKCFKKKIDLLLFFLYLSYFVIIFSRGMMMLILASTLCISLVNKRITFKYIIFIVAAIIIGSWLFGILGNIRVSGVWNDSSIILEMGKIEANPNGILTPLYWAEEYFICSIRNLNYNIEYSIPSYNIVDLLFVSLPDFISKRIFLNRVISVKRLVGVFTSLTTYSLHYSTFGYIGMIIEYGIYLGAGYYIVNTKFSNESLRIVTLSLMTMIWGLSIFDGMIQYSGYSFVLFWGIVIGKFSLKYRKGRVLFIRAK